MRTQTVESPVSWATALFVACVVGCANDPVATSATTNAAIEVELLFENDGVKVYRFSDCGRYIYYTDARGSTSWSVYKGKAGTDHHKVETVK